jgi:hypothetical protein
MSVRYFSKVRGGIYPAKRFAGPPNKASRSDRFSAGRAAPVARGDGPRAGDDHPARDRCDLASARAHGFVRQCDHCPGCLLGARVGRCLRRLTLCPPYPRERLGDVRIDTARVSERRVKNRFHMVSFPAVISRRPVNDKSLGIGVLRPAAKFLRSRLWSNRPGAETFVRNRLRGCFSRV